MTMKEGLQKFTKSKKDLIYKMAMEKINKNQINEFLPPNQKEILAKAMAKDPKNLDENEMDTYLQDLFEKIPTNVKNDHWVCNHFSITVSMNKFIENTGIMPTKSQIAQDTGLSRQTIHKHLTNYAAHPLYAEQLQQFKFMADRVLAKVIKLAVLGNIKAARLYFETIGDINIRGANNTFITNQNNFIQINETIISQEIIMQLSQEQLSSIEAILNSIPNIASSKKA